MGGGSNDSFGGDTENIGGKSELLHDLVGWSVQSSVLSYT